MLSRVSGSLRTTLFHFFEMFLYLFVIVFIWFNNICVWTINHTITLEAWCLMATVTEIRRLWIVDTLKSRDNTLVCLISEGTSRDLLTAAGIYKQLSLSKLPLANWYNRGISKYSSLSVTIFSWLSGFLVARDSLRGKGFRINKLDKGIFS